MVMIFVVSSLLTAAMVLILVPVAHQCGLLALPGEHRHHENPTPLIGGIAIYTAFLVTLRLFDIPISGGLLSALTLLLVFGILDDKWTLPFWIRFVVQAGAACLLIRDGVVLEQLGFLFSEDYATLGGWNYALTIFAVVGVINAINMIDGLDGLCGTVVSLALIGILVLISLGKGDIDSAVVTACLGSVVGFLVFNMRILPRKSARIYLGDAGSMLLGLVVAWLLVKGSQTLGLNFKPVVALWIVAIPLFDTVGVMVRRMARGRSPFKADRTHTHHLLQDLGLSVNQTLAVLMLIGVIAASIGVYAQIIEAKDYYLFYTFLLLFALYVFAMEWGFRHVRK